MHFKDKITGHSMSLVVDHSFYDAKKRSVDMTTADVADDM